MPTKLTVLVSLFEASEIVSLPQPEAKTYVSLPVPP